MRRDRARLTSLAVFGEIEIRSKMRFEPRVAISPQRGIANVHRNLQSFKIVLGRFFPSLGTIWGATTIEPREPLRSNGGGGRRMRAVSGDGARGRAGWAPGTENGRADSDVGAPLLRPRARQTVTLTAGGNHHEYRRVVANRLGAS
jgi:hypothetical protein